MLTSLLCSFLCVFLRSLTCFAVDSGRSRWCDTCSLDTAPGSQKQHGRCFGERWQSGVWRVVCNIINKSTINFKFYQGTAFVIVCTRWSFKVVTQDILAHNCFLSVIQACNSFWSVLQRWTVKSLKLVSRFQFFKVRFSEWSIEKLSASWVVSSNAQFVLSMCFYMYCMISFSLIGNVGEFGGIAVQPSACATRHRQSTVTLLLMILHRL